MTDVTQILSQIEQSDPIAAEQLLPLEMRKVACKAIRSIEEQLDAIEREEEYEIEGYCRS